MIQMNLQLFGEYCTSSNCIGSCVANCMEVCADCSNYCKDGCKGSCVQFCIESCADCSNTCKGCTGCTSCTSCSGCSGCSGCGGACSYSCTGTCTGDCDNACKSTEASSVIANLANNISQGHIIRADDFMQLKQAICKEVTRRKKIPLNSHAPIINTKAIAAQAQEIFDNIKKVNSNKFKTIEKYTSVKVDTLQEARTYIQTLMTENLKK